MEDTTKGSAPKSPSSVPLKKKGGSLSRSPADISRLGLMGMEEQVELTNCPHIPALFLPWVPNFSWGSTRRGGGRKKGHRQKVENLTQLKEGQKNRLSPVPQNTNDAKDDCASLKQELHSERARVQLPEGLSKRHTKDHVLPSPARKVDFNAGLHIEEHPSSPEPCAPSSRPAKGEHHSPAPAMAKENESYSRLRCTRGTNSKAQLQKLPWRRAVG